MNANKCEQTKFSHLECLCTHMEFTTFMRKCKVKINAENPYENTHNHHKYT